MRCYKSSSLLLLFFIIFLSCDDDFGAKHRYSFFVAGHVYGTPGGNNVGVHPPLKDKFDYIRSYDLMQFGVFTGDIVLTGTEENWDEIDRDVELLGKKVYFAVGNHDMTNREFYENRYGQTYYSFLYDKDLFIFLDPNIDHWNISGTQLEFLKSIIADNYLYVEHIFVFFHQVIWWEPDNIFKNIVLNSKAGREENVNFWTEVEPLFRALPVPVFFFAGDVGAFHYDSEFMYYKYENITLIASGMGGMVHDNFVIVDILEDGSVNFNLIALNTEQMDSMGDLEDFILK